MISLKNKTNKGFTIVELLIVIIVIGILATLVITTYNGIQKKARDTKRKTDINAIQGQLEAYQAEIGKYPTLANMKSTIWVKGNLKGLDLSALQDPNWTTSDTSCKDSDSTDQGTLVGSTSNNCYVYDATPDSPACDNSTTDCTGYTLTAALEEGGTYSKVSLN